MLHPHLRKTSMPGSGEIGNNSSSSSKLSSSSSSSSKLKEVEEEEKFPPMPGVLDWIV